jgi:amidase
LSRQSTDDDELCWLPATELARLLREGFVSAREVVAAHLARIERCNEAVNAVVTLTAESALAAAQAADETLLRSGPVGPLHGLPVAHKDLQDTAGVRTTYGSPIYAEHVPQASSPLVERMAAAGAISLGKTNTPEFGAGSHTYNAVFGVTRNPWDLERSAGGSSGGAAAALATGMIALADGSDMGGSLRNPASFCNVVGLRPSASLLPQDAAQRSELSVEGPMGRHVADVALLLEVLSDGRCRTAPEAASRPRLAGRRVAWCPSPAGIPVEATVRATLAGVPDLLADLGADVIEAAPDFSGAEESFRVIRAFEFATGLGAEYARHGDRLNADVRWNIEQGLRLTDADLFAARALRAELATRIATWMAGLGALALPVTQVAPFPLEQQWPAEVDGVPGTTYLDWMRSCYLISATGLPALSVPFGFTPIGLPVGLQLVGRPGCDGDLLALAAALEEAAGAVGRRPPSCRRL